MSKRLDENLGSVAYDGLIVSTEPASDVFVVTIRKGTEKATLARGTVLALSGGSAGDGKMVVLGTAAVTNETLTANCVLCDETEVGTTADEPALAYRTGHLARNKMIVASGHTLTAADEEALRKGGILLSDAVSY